MWDIKYRPTKFSEVLGQDGNVQLLKSRLRNGAAFDTSYIFAGGHGQGKTTLARIYARAMLCLDPNKEDPEPCNQCDNCTTILNGEPGAFVERDAASQGTIEHIRELVEQLPFVIMGAPKRINLFDEAHRMSLGAQDVLLKPIEEKKMVGIFCTTEPEKIRGPIRSRCEEYTIRKVTREDILKRMQTVLTAESVEFQEDAVCIAIDHSGGHVRDVLNKLEMVSQVGPITIDTVREYLHLSVVSTYYEILLALSDPKKAIALVEQACERVAPEEVATGLAEAAMNSYRLANGMFADFVYVDRALGTKVYELYGPHVVRFADWFLRSRYTSLISLVRDIVIFSESPSNTPPKGGQPPILFTMGAAAPVVQPTTTNKEAPSAPQKSSVVETTQAPAEQQEAVETEPEATMTPREDFLRTQSLHDQDKRLHFEMPRMGDQAKVDLAIPERGSEAEERRIMKPEEWRQGFKRNWPGGGNPHG